MSELHFTREELVSSRTVYHTYPWQVRLQDIDAAGIVFFTKIIEACHDAYMDFFQSLGPFFKENLKVLKLVIPIVHSEADFLSPLRFLDEVEVQLVKIKHRETKYALGYRLVEKEQKRAVAVVQTVHVPLDPARFERVPVPIELREKFDSLCHSIGLRTHGLHPLGETREG